MTDILRKLAPKSVIEAIMKINDPTYVVEGELIPLYEEEPEVEELKEGNNIISDLQRAAKYKTSVSFESGESCFINENHAKMAIDVWRRMGPEDQISYANRLFESVEEFQNAIGDRKPRKDAR